MKKLVIIAALGLGLAACNNAPMMMVDHVFHEYLTPERVDKVLDELK